MVDEIERGLGRADALLEMDKNLEAYAEYDAISAKLLTGLRDGKTARKVSKAAGWVAAALTGGFGAEDFIVVPAVNKILLSLLGIDLEATLKYLLHCETQKLQLLVISPSTFSILSPHQVLLNFLLTYRLTTSLADRTALDKLFDLVNPLLDSSPVSGTESQLDIGALQMNILAEAKGGHAFAQYLNGFLYLYLSSVHLTDSPLFQYLRPTFEPFSASSDTDNDEDSNISAYYGSILGLKGKVTRDDIRKKYRDLIKQYHPDKHQNVSEEERAKFEAKTKTVNEAFAWFRKEHGV